MQRINISSGSIWEPKVGYSRAVRIGGLIFVAGTTANTPEADAYTQTKEVLQRIEAALRQAGSSLNDVVQTRMFVTDISQWEEYGRAHAESFGEIRPVASMIEVKQLIDPRLKIEMEVVAVVNHGEEVE
jgi:enamine deaminase RidA (YjgF/YER057c/UK114 family)